VIKALKSLSLLIMSLLLIGRKEDDGKKGATDERAAKAKKTSRANAFWLRSKSTSLPFIRSTVRQITQFVVEL
jgi:hypothetical protein